MSGFDPAPFAAAWRRQNERERRLIEERSTEARSEAERLAAAFADDAGATGVILFGSVAEGTVRNLDFDVDIAIEGGDWSRARSIADESPFRVDVVELDRLPPHIRERVLTRGIRLR